MIKTKKEKKERFSEIDMVALKFNKPKNGILSNFFSPVGLFKSLPAHILHVLNIESKKTNDLKITKKRKKEGLVKPSKIPSFLWAILWMS